MAGRWTSRSWRALARGEIQLSLILGYRSDIAMRAAFQAGCRSEQLPLLAVWVAAIRRSCPRARRLSPATYRETGIHMPDTGYVAGGESSSQDRGPHA